MSDRSKHPSSYRLSPRTKGQLEELARRWGLNRSEVLALLIDRAHREDRRNTVNERRVWVIEPTRSNLEDSGPSVEEIEDAGATYLAGDGFSLVEGEHMALEAMLRDHPGWRLMIPRDGKWVGAGGDHVYVVSARTTEDIRELYDALGLAPAMFDAESWEEVDPDIIDIPTF